MSSASLSISRSASIEQRGRRAVPAVFAAALLLGAAAVPCRAQEPPSDPASWSREAKEDFLRTAEIVESRVIPEGTTRSSRATLRDARGAHDAHIQSVDQAVEKFEGEGGQWELNFRDTWKFNLAAYVLDRALGLNMIPPTVERRVADRPSAVTWWIDDVVMDEKARLERGIKPPYGDRERWNRQIYILKVFDQLIGNKDRNLGNIIITKGWNVWIIDHTRAFRPYRRLMDPDDLVKCDRGLLEAMRRLDRATVEARLGAYLSKMEITGLLARRDRIVKFFDDKAAREGEGAVLFDYLSGRGDGPKPEG